MPVTCLTEADVRAYLVDQAAQANALDFGMDFTTADITAAMNRCAREYNGMMPSVDFVSGSFLPAETNAFLDGVALHLYIIKLQHEQKQDIEYAAGEVNASAAGTQIKHCIANIKMFGDRFREAALLRKRDRNNRAAYGNIG